MRLRMILCATVLIGAALNSNAHAQEQAKNQTKAVADTQESTKKWMEWATPGEGHKYLEQFIGKWDVTIRAWMEAGKPPVESKGSCDAKWMMDGRFVSQEMTAQLMGMPFKSQDILGYDNYKKRYVLAHIDGMSTAIYTGEGTLDSTKQVLTSFGKMDEPVIDERDKVVKYVTRVLSKDKYVFEAYDEVGSPNEYKALEITYTRVRP